jgi:hypothetical protein
MSSFLIKITPRYTTGDENAGYSKNGASKKDTQIYGYGQGNGEIYNQR